MHYCLHRQAQTGYHFYMLATAAVIAFAVASNTLGAAVPACEDAASALADLGVLGAGFLSYVAAVQLRQAFARAGDAHEH